jgi:hypothetical protein
MREKEIEEHTEVAADNRGKCTLKQKRRFYGLNNHRIHVRSGNLSHIGFLIQNN